MVPEVRYDEAEVPGLDYRSLGSPIGSPTLLLGLVLGGSPGASFRHELIGLPFWMNYYLGLPLLFLRKRPN
mgnify:CR=1 FL=1